MKKTILVAFAGLTLITCKKEEKPKAIKDYLVLSGKIENYKKRDLKLKNYASDVKIKFNKKTKSFSDSLNIKESGYYQLIINKKVLDLYLSDTIDTQISFDYKKPNVIKFEGNNANINNYFLDKNKLITKILISGNHYFSLEEEEFLDLINKYKDAVTEDAISKNLNSDFLKIEIKNIEYEHLDRISKYENFYSILNDDRKFKVSENFPDAFENFNLNDTESFKNSSSYRSMLNEELKNITTKKLKEGEDYYLTYIEVIQTEITEDVIKNNLLYNNAINSITYTDNLKEFYNKFMGYSTNEAHKKEITDTYNTLKTVAKGKEAPKFFGFENYNGGTTSLDDLLNKGKYLYIDVWATWCGFCKKEIPLLKRLEEQYHGKNIEFVSISVDVKSKHDKWKQTIIDREMTGIQLFSGKVLADLEWAQKFLIKGLPKFILIAPDGKIVTPTAPAPSEGEKLINIFDNLGIK